MQHTTSIQVAVWQEAIQHILKYESIDITSIKIHFIKHNFVATIVDSNRTNDVVGKPFLSDRRCYASKDKSQLTTSQINTHYTYICLLVATSAEGWFASCHKLEYPTLFCCCCCFPIVGFFFLYTYNNADLQELDVEASAITGGQGGAAAAAGGALTKNTTTIYIYIFMFLLSSIFILSSKGIYDFFSTVFSHLDEGKNISRLACFCGTIVFSISVNFIHFWSLSNIFFAGAAFLFFCLFSHILSEYKDNNNKNKQIYLL
ncbi:hypothetical protein ACJX0J_011087 [Zea mays]